MSKLKVFWNKVFDILDDILAYVLTIAGILLSNYLPLLKTSGIITVEADWWRVGVSAIVALILIGKQESLTVDDDGTTSKAKAGRKKKFGLRMSNALSQGMMWAQLMDVMPK